MYTIEAHIAIYLFSINSTKCAEKYWPDQLVKYFFPITELYEVTWKRTEAQRQEITKKKGYG